MSADWEKDMDDSAYDFMRVVWPVIKKPIGGGQLVSVESVISNISFIKDLDIYAGIDAFQIQKLNNRMRGIGSRVQWDNPNYPPNKDWHTFTIRKSRSSGATTEYEKRIKAIDGDGNFLWPSITVQAYVTKRRTGTLINTAVVDTKAMFDFIKAGKAEVKENNDDGNKFYRVDWEQLALYTKKIFILHKKGRT